MGAILLIHRITKKSKTWFNSFMEVLASHGYSEVVVMMERSKYYVIHV